MFNNKSRFIMKNTFLVMFYYLIKQRTSGRNKLIGIMIESNLNEGKQNLNEKGKLKYGVSITDSCLSFEQTEHIVTKSYQELE